MWNTVKTLKRATERERISDNDQTSSIDKSIEGLFYL